MQVLQRKNPGRLEIKMEFLAVGINYRKTPIELRECFSFEPDSACDLLARLKGESLVNEALYLGTCNRAEVYAVTDKDGSVCTELQDKLCAFARVDPFSTRDFWYSKTGTDAVRHLFRVASSLDAMVVGEAQILGQIKEAYFKARDQGTTGPFIDRAMLRAFQIARKIRSETEIGRGQVSVASVAVGLAVGHLKELSDLTVLVIGAGEMGALVVRQLKKHGTGRILVANRTFEKAAIIAEHTQGEAIEWSNLQSAINRADIIVSSTGAANPVIDKEMVAAATRSRVLPLVLIDLGTPRDMKPEISELENVRLFNIDDLSRVAKENGKRRESEAKKAETLVSEESEKFLIELSTPDFLTPIAMLNRKFAAICEQEIGKTLSKLQGITDDQRKTVEAGAQSIIAKILHEPVRELRNEGSDDLERQILSESLCRLFHLDEE